MMALLLAGLVEVVFAIVDNHVDELLVGQVVAAVVLLGAALAKVPKVLWVVLWGVCSGSKENGEGRLELAATDQAAAGGADGADKRVAEEAEEEQK